MNRRNTIRNGHGIGNTAPQGTVMMESIAGLANPEFYQCDLVRDEAGVRLPKRHHSLSIHKLRDMGSTPEEVRAGTRPARNHETAATSDRLEAA